MKKLNIKKTIFCLCLFAGIFFTGCPVYITITANEQDTFYYNFSTITGSSFNEMISSFDSNIPSMNNQTSSIYDTIEIERSLFNLGLTNVHATTIKLPNTEEKLDINFTSKKNKFNFIKIAKDLDNIKTKSSVTLSPEILQNLITEQNSIIQKYADLLMAPCFTNEVLTNEEYIELVASLYGENVAKELTSGTIKIEIKNAHSNKSSKSISIPIIDILTLTKEKTFTFQ